MSKLFEDMIVTDEDQKIVEGIIDKNISITTPVGCAVVVCDILRQVCRSLATDAVKSLISGDRESAEVMALIGLELDKFYQSLEKAVSSVDGSDELIRIAKRSAVAEKFNAASKGKETLQ